MKKKNYINNKQLFDEMVIYRQQLLEARAKGEPNPIPSKYIGLAIWEIARRLSTKSNFSGYSYREDMVCDGIEVCLKYALNSFDPEKTQNPFAYFTTSIYNAFVKRINEESNQQYLKYKNYQLMNMEGEPGNWLQLNDISQEFIKNFEEKKLRKKKGENTANTLVTFIEPEV